MLSLINHARWRSHGRSIKIEDLEPLLKIQKIDDDPKLSDMVYRIHVVLRLLCDSTSIFKIFLTADSKIFRQATQATSPLPVSFPPQEINIVNLNQTCPRCGAIHKIYAKTKLNLQLDEQARKEGYKPFPKNGKIVCTCKHEIDIIGLKNQIEAQMGLKLII